MTFTDGRPVWRVVHVAATTMMLTLAVILFVNSQWFLGSALAFGAVFLLLARMPLFRLAVTREPDAILCRYVPWYEPAPYLATSMLLVFGIFGVVAGFRPDFGPMMGILGVASLVMLPVGVAKFWRGYRRCWLRITPATLTVPDPDRSYTEVTIARQQVVSIAPVTENVGFGSTTLVPTDITFRDGDGRTGREHTVRVGPAPADDTVWLTVLPGSLLVALQDWVRAEPGDPGLLDRVEAQLRSREGTTDPRRLATLPAVGPAAGKEVAPAATDSPVAPVQPAGSLDAPRRVRRWFSRGPLSLLVVASALGAGYPLYRHIQRDAAPAPQTAEHPACPVAGARVVRLPTKSGAEPTIELPLAPGWVTQDIDDPQLAGEDSLRGYLNDPAITEDDYPFLRVMLQTSPATGEATVKDLLATSGKIFPTVTPCGQTLYRLDTAGYNPDGKGEQTGTTVFSIVNGKDGSSWIAAAIVKTRNPDNPGYIAQRDALVAGFHAGFP